MNIHLPPRTDKRLAALPHRILTASIAAVALTAAFCPAHAATVANWTLASGSYTGGRPTDSVGGHDFLTVFDHPVVTFGGNIGGPSSSSSFFSGNGYYGQATGSTIFPTDNFILGVHAQITTAAQTSVLFSSSGFGSNGIQIGLLGGNWVAFIAHGGNLQGDLIGAGTALINTPTELAVAATGGVFSFTINGVTAGVPVIPAHTFVGFNGLHIGVAPNATSTFNGYVSDLSVQTTPEPTSAALLLCSATALLSLRRRR